jgi:hypothetical protein
MTVTVNFATVANSIADIHFEGITVKDIDEIPEAGTLQTPVLFPQPNDFITDVQASFETFGSGGMSKMNLQYTLNYVFLLNELGGGISSFDNYTRLISSVASIVKTIMSNDAVTGAVDIQLNGIPSLSPITDPSGNQFWGCLLSFRVLEFVQ